jgi:3-hydroxyacyl-CoA dehydrogenase
MRGGLLTGFDTTVKGTPYGILAMAALTGLFSKQAVDMLAHVADVFFTTKGDDKRMDKITKEKDATTQAGASGQTGAAA